MVVPADVVPAVHAEFVAGCGDLAQAVGMARGDRYGGQQRAPQHRLPGVDPGRARTQHLAEEAALAEDAQRGEPGAIRPHRHVPARATAEPLEEFEQSRRTVAQTDLGVDVDLECEDAAWVERSALGRSIVAHCVRNHSIVRASPSRSAVSASTPRVSRIRRLSGTRRAMSS